MAVSITEFEKALIALSESLEFAKQSTDPMIYKIARDASIQRFEFCVELAWKTSAKVLGSASTTAKPVIREMAQNGLIDSPEKWFEFIEARNRSSHTYDENQAKLVFSSATDFLAHGQNLHKKLLSK